MKNKLSLNTVVTLANVVALVCEVAQEVVGNEVSDSINGNHLTRDVIGDMAMSQLQGHHNKTLGAI